MDVTNEWTLRDAVEICFNHVTAYLEGYDVQYPYLAGSPGGGKTTATREIALKHGYGFKAMHFSTRPYENNSGIPKFTYTKNCGEHIDPDLYSSNKKGTLTTVWSQPDTVREMWIEAKKAKDKSKSDNSFKPSVIIMFDDMHLCDDLRQELLFELLTERTLRGYKIPDNVGLMFAGNLRNLKAGARKRNAAISNRTAVYYQYTPVEEWAEDYAYPHKINPSVVSFLLKNSSLFHEEESEDIWASPRSWTKFGNILTFYEQISSSKLTIETVNKICAANVGTNCAQPFTEYYSLGIDIDSMKILESGNITFTDVPLKNYLMVSKVTHRYLTIPDDKRDKYRDRFVKIFLSIVKELPELAAISTDQLRSNTHELVSIMNVAEIDKPTKDRFFYEFSQAYVLRSGS